jgi:hypothetical protein
MRRQDEAKVTLACSVLLLLSAWGIAARGLSQANMAAAAYTAGYCWFILAFQLLLSAGVCLSYRFPVFKIPACLFLGVLTTNIWLLIDGERM